MDPSELLRKVAGAFESLEVRYLVTGSMATIAFGEPRFTNDIDVVAWLPETKVADYCELFPPPEYYCYPPAVREAVRNRSQFNIIHPSSGLKADIMIPKDSEFDRSRLSRCVWIPTSGTSRARFASPEDVIIKKLDYFKEGGSDKHIRDIAGVLRVRGDRLDRTYIAEWAERLGLASEWRHVLERVSRAGEQG
ncbi:MAG TPA: hypothetical protein DD670_21285 [Planctomycetaceae bacterium]|nr:hypothetical protein [Planctomycetaceae bacterium]